MAVGAGADSKLSGSVSQSCETKTSANRCIQMLAEYFGERRDVDTSCHIDFIQCACVRACVRAYVCV